MAIGVGYAGLGTRELTVSGGAKTNSSDPYLDVNFIDVTVDKGTSTATTTQSVNGNMATFSVTGMKKDDVVKFTYIVQNQHDEDTGAKLSSEVQNYTLISGTGEAAQTITSPTRDEFVMIEYKIYKATVVSGTDGNPDTYDVSTTEWNKTGDVLGHNQVLAVVVTVTQKVNPNDLLEITDYTLKLGFDAVYTVN